MLCNHLPLLRIDHFLCKIRPAPTTVLCKGNVARYDDLQNFHLGSEITRFTHNFH